MDTISREELRRLSRPRAELCVSLYFPVGFTADAKIAASIRLKDLARLAEESLLARGVKPAIARQLLKPAHDLAETKLASVAPCQGLAMLLSGTESLTLVIPMAVEEVAWVGNRYYIRPLIPLSKRKGGYWLLAASQNRVRLFQDVDSKLVEVSLQEMPEGIADLLDKDRPDGTEQPHTARLGNNVKKDAAFHGQGGASDYEKDRLVPYFREIDRALGACLHGDSRPLVFAGVDYLFSIFQSVTRYPHLLAQHIAGNPDRLDAARLEEQARAIVQPLAQRAAQEALRKFRGAVGSYSVCDDVQEIIPAAAAGRVESLLVRDCGPLWGEFDAADNVVRLHGEQIPMSEDLLDRACVEVLNHRGEVHAVPRGEIPNGVPMGALYRYAVAAPGH